MADFSVCSQSLKRNETFKTLLNEMPELMSSRENFTSDYFFQFTFFKETARNCTLLRSGKLFR